MPKAAGHPANAEAIAAFRDMCRRDLYSLAKNVLYAHLDHNLLSDTFHKPICNYVHTTPYTENLYLFQRGSFKTALLNASLNVQRILRHPDIRILIASNKGENAEEMMREIQGHLTNPLLVQAFPEILEKDPKRLPEWTQSAVTVKNKRRGRGSTVSTIGVTGELTSKHYDHVTYDDVVGKENSQTKDLREGVIDFYKKSRPLIDPVTPWGEKSTKDFIGTSWHYADLWAFLEEQKRRHGMQLGVLRKPCWEACRPGDPLGADVPGFGWVRPTFPERWTIQALLEERRTMGSSDFAAQYLLDPVSADTAHFKREKIEISDAIPPLDDLWVVMAVDPANSVKSWADYSGIAIGGFDRRNDLWLLEIIRQRRDDYGLINLIYDCYRRFPMIRAIGFETTSFAKTYRSLMTVEGDRRGKHLPIIGLERDTKIGKNQRIAGMQGYWEAGQIHASRACTHLADFLDEADKFRTDKESTHDDLLDAVVDLYQVRGRPYAPEQPLSLDPERAEQVRWQMELKARRPEMDNLSLHVAWLHEKRRQSDVDRDEAFTRAESFYSELWS